MTLDLFQVLHTAVEADDGTDPGLDLRPVTTRIRRRRYVRNGARVGVGVAAAGAVVLGATHLPSRSSALPATRSDATPGECGSALGSLPQADPDVVGAVRLANGDATPRDAGGHLGTFAGSSLDITTSTTLSDAAAKADEKLAQTYHEDELATAEQRVEDAKKAVAIGSPGADDELAAANENLESVQSALPTQFVPVDGWPQVYVTHDGTVVGGNAVTVDGSAVSQSSIAGGVRTSSTERSLTTCSVDGDREGTPLPAGTYQVYLGFGGQDAGTPTSVAGPWSFDVVRAAAPQGLPDGFPSRLPLVGGKLTSATALEGGGWTVVVAVGADDALEAAAELLAPVEVADSGDDTSSQGYFQGTALSPMTVTLGNEGTWSVQVTLVWADDGTASLRYRVTEQ